MRDIRTADDGPAPSERSIRNISVGHRKHAGRPSVSEDHSESPMEEHHLPHRRPRRKRRRFLLIALAVVVVCALLGVLLSAIFAGATITVHPRMQIVQAPATLRAQLNAPVGVLSYQKINVTRSAEVTVPAQGVQKVSRAASGLITVSNSYNASSQRLIANTRFEASDGKIYRIRDSVTVPGMVGEKAGSVTATVYADSPGPDYNKPAGTTFTIPGFKGDPRYSKFSAKADAAIAGGFVGDEPAVSPADLAAAKTSLQQKLDADVRAAAASEIPEGSVAIPGTLQVSFADLVQTPGEGKTAKLTQSGTATGFVVRQGDLASMIARGSVDDYKGEALLFGETNMDVKVASSSKLTDEAITLELTGQATLVWQFDQQALLQALLGKNKSEFQTIIQAFRPAIERADASIRPFWKGSFPNTPEDIRIKLEV